MTLREEFENEIRTNKGGISVLFETSNQHYIEWLEGKLIALRQYNVSGRSELLLAFIEHIKKDNELTETVNANDVEAFIKSQQ